MEKILQTRKIKNGIIVPIEREIDENGKIKRVTDNYIDISYFAGRYETASQVLSNLYRYKLKYTDQNRGHVHPFGFHKGEVQSIEAVIQSLRYGSLSEREYCYDYFGKEAYHLRGLKPDEWKKTGTLYCIKLSKWDREVKINEINRFSEEYQDLLDSIYLCAYDNPIFRKNLKDSFPKELEHDHSDDQHETLLTRTEYLSRLYALRYLAIASANNPYENYSESGTLKRVRKELR